MNKIQFCGFLLSIISLVSCKATHYDLNEGLLHSQKLVSTQELSINTFQATQTATLSKEPENLISSFKNGPDSCAEVIWKFGGSFMAKILEVEPNKIIYVKCNTIDDDVRFVNKKEVKEIRYPDGTSDYFSTKGKSILSYHQGKGGYKIYFTNGDSITAYALKVIDYQVKYSKSENTSGPVYIINKSEILNIKDSTGNDIKFLASEESLPSSDKIKKMDIYGPLACILILFPPVLALLAILFGFNDLAPGLATILLGTTPLAFIFGLVGLSRFKYNPGQFSGKGYSIASVILSSALMITFLILFIWFLYSIGI